MSYIDRALASLDTGARNADTDRKLRELILYVSKLSEDDPGFGATKLNKLLYFADFEAYRRFGRSITGCEYMGLEQGPVPRHLFPVRDKLVERRDLVIIPQKRQGYTQQRPFALRPAELACFEPRDIDLIHEVVQECRTMNAREIADASHDIKWRVVGTDRGDFPYNLAFLTERRIEASDSRRTAALAREYGW